MAPPTSWGSPGPPPALATKGLGPRDSQRDPGPGCAGSPSAVRESRKGEYVLRPFLGAAIGGGLSSAPAERAPGERGKVGMRERGCPKCTGERLQEEGRRVGMRGAGAGEQGGAERLAGRGTIGAGRGMRRGAGEQVLY